MYGKKPFVNLILSSFAQETAMFRSGSFAVFTMLLAVFALLAPPAVAAPAFSKGSVCTTLVRVDADAALVARAPEGWDCSGKHWKLSGTLASLVRIDMGGRPTPSNAQLTTRLTQYRQLSITAIGVNGQIAVRNIAHSDVTFSRTQWQMRLPLPHISGPVAAYVLKVTGARHEGLLSDVRIGPPPDEAKVSNTELILAALCGLLCMPLVLNFAFYRALRQRFVLWHAMAVFSMLVQTMVTSGLINRFMSLSITKLCLLSAISWSVMVLAAIRFFVDLIEPGILTRRQKLALELLSPWIVFWTAYYLLAEGVFLPTVAPLYYAAFIPVIAVVSVCMVLAVLHGSRAAWFQVVGWMPLIIMGTIRIASLLGLTDTPLSLMMEQHLAIGFEVILTSIGVADRFMSIRLQRDFALNQARLNANLAEHDPLTGLLNRRAIERRFKALFGAGFHTMAAIDLDHFKAINDTHGHAAGDAVLRTVAQALSPDANTIAVRLGGEEFLLLLRGERAAERAERRRQSIPSRVAKAQPGLARLVTASMGVLTCDPDEKDAASFEEIYARCDARLYEAKESGRNCVCGDIPDLDVRHPVLATS